MLFRSGGVSDARHKVAAGKIQEPKPGDWAGRNDFGNSQSGASSNSPWFLKLSANQTNRRRSFDCSQASTMAHHSPKPAADISTGPAADWVSVQRRRPLRRRAEITYPSCWFFRPPASLHKASHSPTMLPFVRLAGDRKSGAICASYFCATP